MFSDTEKYFRKIEIIRYKLMKSKYIAQNEQRFRETNIHPNKRNKKNKYH